jgi:hypothetical protein
VVVAAGTGALSSTSALGTWTVTSVCSGRSMLFTRSLNVALNSSVLRLHRNSRRRHGGALERCLAALAAGAFHTALILHAVAKDGGNRPRATERRGLL